MNKKTPSPKVTSESELLSDLELARFLMKMAGLYDDKAFGNARLSASLRNLAYSLKNKVKTQSSKEEVRRDNNFHYHYDREILSKLPLSEVSDTISNHSVTKKHLVDLGYFRFGIPMASLKKLTIDGIKKVIKSSCDHELSIKTIESEASSSGKSRLT